MSPKSLPQAIRLNPLQQWQYFRHPGMMDARFRQQFTDLVVLHFQGKDHVGILSSEGIRQVFSHTPEEYDVFWKEAFTGLSGNDVIFVLAGQKHQRERERFAYTFNANKYRSYAEAIRNITHHHLARWQPGQTVRAIDTTSEIWLDVIMHLFFGLAEDEFLEEGKRIHAQFQKSMHPLIVFFPALQRNWFPIWHRYAGVKAAFSNWVDRYLEEHGAEERDDVIGQMLMLHNQSDQPVSQAYIRDTIYTFLGPGHQTTATALAWALYELSRHPDILHNLRTELASTRDSSDLSLRITLPYLTAVCNETLRLHPIIAECARVPRQPIEILGYTIPAGLAVVISILGFHHDPRLYPEPEKFIPERFIGHTYSAFEFLPFGGGHRRCMGAGLAEYVMKIALAEIVTNWEFEPAGLDQDVRQSLTMGPRHGVRLHITGKRQ